MCLGNIKICNLTTFYFKSIRIIRYACCITITLSGFACGFGFVRGPVWWRRVRRCAVKKFRSGDSENDFSCCFFDLGLFSSENLTPNTRLLSYLGEACLNLNKNHQCDHYQWISIFFESRFALVGCLSR